MPQWLRSLAARLSVLDWIRIGVLVAGLLCLVTGALPVSDASASIRRIAPLLLFLGSVIILAELAKRAGVFDVIAIRIAIVGRGTYGILFFLCVAFAAVTTIFLNLDTTAVLLTPVMLALAPRADIRPLPLAMTTVWLANTASILLPVSNLTNLLASNRVALGTTQFAGRMWLAQLATIAVTMVFLWIFYWRRGARGTDRYVPPQPFVIRDRVFFGVCGVACLLFIAGVLAGLAIEIAATCAAAVVLACAAWRDREGLRWSLIPWQLLVFVTGLFLVVPTLSRHGLSHIMTDLIGTGGGTAGTFRAGATGAGLANVVNNLPAYVAGEAVIPSSGHTQLLGLLVGVNVGPVITPWASLATLLWFEWCRRRQVRVPLRKFVLTGAGLAVTGLAAGVGALLLT